MLLLRQCPEPILHILFCPVLGEAVALKPLSSRQSLHDVHYTGHLRDRRASDRAPRRQGHRAIARTATAVCTEN